MPSSVQVISFMDHLVSSSVQVVSFNGSSALLVQSKSYFSEIIFSL